MAKYNNARFDQFSKIDQGLYTISDQIEWNDLLNRDDLYQYNEDIEDNDYLLNTYSMDELYAIPHTLLKIESKYNQRPDILAYDLFGDPDFWWIICFMNGIEDFQGFIAGITVKVPERTYLLSWLMRNKFESQKNNA